MNSSSLTMELAEMQHPIRYFPPGVLDIVDIQIGDHLYRVQKSKLSEKSEFLRMTFMARTEEKLKDIKIQEKFVRCIIKYINTYCVDEDDINGDYLGLFSAAHKLGFKDLAIFCEQVLLNTMNIKLIDV